MIDRAAMPVYDSRLARLSYHEVFTYNFVGDLWAVIDDGGSEVSTLVINDIFSASSSCHSPLKSSTHIENLYEVR